MRSPIYMKSILAVALIPLAFAAARLPSAAQTEDGHVVPAPLKDETAGTRTTAVAVLAGGCFWGVQGVYQHVRGVTGAVSGFAGGEASTAEYSRVGTGRTGHAEAVQITYDPRVISYGKLLQVFFSVVHDPTQLDRQGPDVGTEYRSAIFPADGEQEAIARAYIAQLTRAREYNAAIVTTIEVDRKFFPAGAYHQDYMERNPQDPYIRWNDAPKLADLERLFAPIYSATPVLVGAPR